MERAKSSPRPFSFADSVHLATALGRQQIAPLLLLFALGTLITLCLESSMQSLTRNEESMRWMFQVGMGLWDMTEGILMILILSWGIPAVKALTEAHFQRDPFSDAYLGGFFTEYLRYLANVLVWGLALVLPGFWRYCQLIFVPYIALFAKPYRDDRADAVTLATELSRGRVGKILAVAAVATILQLALEFIPQLVPVLHEVPIRAMFGAVSFGISIWFYSYFYLLFEQAMEEFQWEQP